MVVWPARWKSRSNIEYDPRLEWGAENRRPAQRTLVNASIGSGGTGSGGFGNSGGGGHGGDGSESDDGEAKRDEAILLRWKGWQERVAADPSFPYKVFIEQVTHIQPDYCCAHPFPMAGKCLLIHMTFRLDLLTGVNLNAGHWRGSSGHWRYVFAALLGTL